MNIELILRDDNGNYKFSRIVDLHPGATLVVVDGDNLADIYTVPTEEKDSE